VFKYALLKRSLFQDDVIKSKRLGTAGTVSHFLFISHGSFEVKNSEKMWGRKVTIPRHEPFAISSSPTQFQLIPVKVHCPLNCFGFRMMLHISFSLKREKFNRRIKWWAKFIPRLLKIYASFSASRDNGKIREYVIFQFQYYAAHFPPVL